MGNKWKPLSDGEYDGQHRGDKVEVDGEWLRITERDLFGGEPFKAEIAFASNVRLCQSVPADEGVPVAAIQIVLEACWQQIVFAQTNQTGENVYYNDAREKVKAWLDKQKGGGEDATP